MRGSRLPLYLIFAALFAVLLIAAYEYSSYTIWDGSFKATVVLQEAEPWRIKAVTYDTCFRVQDAEEAVKGHWDFPEWKTVRSFPDGTITVQVPCSGRQSALRLYKNTYTQHRYVLLRVDFDDGDRRYVYAPIPEKPKGGSVLIPVKLSR
jgi:hypothetical protein